MKIFTGKVIAKKGEKTVRVVVETLSVHPIYKKRLKRVKKYLVHDEKDAQVGQKVKFVTSKPFSKLKKWQIIEILK